MSELGKILLGFGVVLVILGSVLLLAGTLSGKLSWLGRLPGDFHIQRGNWSVYVPLSILLAIVLSVFSRFGSRGP